MNRLILIGNGFDLAHGLKSSYCDFIKWYVPNSINQFCTTNIYSDALLDIRPKFPGYYFKGYITSLPDTSLGDLKNLQEHNYISVSIKSDFLLSTLEQISKVNWVDLENGYFEKLVKCKYGRQFDFQRVKKLNTEFECLKEILELYLSTEQQNKMTTVSDDLVNIFCENINQNDIVTTKIQSQAPKRNLILNFNYTNTLQKYQERCNTRVPTKIIHIHGELNAKKNPIIFGYGDEYDKNYLEFEGFRNKDILTHIKSFGYFKASNYHNLIRFIENDIFQVFILGHSLGLSDRTMLRQIFEHEKCKSIKIFYHETDDNKNDYTDKTYDISNHFLDKGSMRKKIAPFDLSYPMPQPGI